MTLTCSYTSSLPAPNSYTWYRGGRQLEGSRQEMVLKNMTAEQAGEYRCQADNGIGQSPSPPITITVLCKCRGREKRDLQRGGGAGFVITSSPGAPSATVASRASAIPGCRNRAIWNRAERGFYLWISPWCNHVWGPVPSSGARTPRSW